MSMRNGAFGTLIILEVVCRCQFKPSTAFFTLQLSLQLSCCIMLDLSCSWALHDIMTRVAFTRSMSFGFNVLVLSGATSRENNIASPCYKYVYQHCILYCIVLYCNLYTKENNNIIYDREHITLKKNQFLLCAHNSQKISIPFVCYSKFPM